MRAIAVVEGSGSSPCENELREGHTRLATRRRQPHGPSTWQRCPTAALQGCPPAASATTLPEKWATPRKWVLNDKGGPTSLGVCARRTPAGAPAGVRRAQTPKDVGPPLSLSTHFLGVAHFSGSVVADATGGQPCSAAALLAFSVAHIGAGCLRCRGVSCPFGRHLSGPGSQTCIGRNFSDPHRETVPLRPPPPPSPPAGGHRGSSVVCRRLPQVWSRRPTSFKNGLSRVCLCSQPQGRTQRTGRMC